MKAAPLAVRLASALSVAASVHAAVNAVRLPRVPRGASTTRRVALLVPARDEAADIAACVRSLVAQRGLTPVEVVVLDDESSDSTAVLASEAGARVVSGTPPPPGWLGKPWACAQLASAAPDAEVLVFVDADVRLEPDAVAGAVALLDAASFDLVSPYPRQLAVGVAERLLQPLLVWTWLTFLPLPAAYTSRRTSLAAANGQFLAVRRSVYDAAGGHAAVRGEILDDVALARAVRRAGGTGGIVAGADVAACRMYRGAAAVRDGYGKSLGRSVGNSPAASIAVALAMTAVWTLPVSAWRSPAGAVALAAGIAGRLIAARVGGSRAWPDALAHPLSVAAAAGLAVDSVARRAEVTWRGRPVRVAA